MEALPRSSGALSAARPPHVGMEPTIDVGLADPGYPRRLRDLPSPPRRLWIAGDADVLAAGTAVTVVGTRRMTAYGERLAQEVGGALARAGALVISGLAQGIDATAHTAALEAGGRTVAVLGAGIEAYLREVRGSPRRLAARILARGALLSQYPPDATALGWMFARRNATMAALGDVVVIVEAPEGSGALITAADALRIGRPVYAIPGAVGTAAARGTNGLIAAGRAMPLVDVDTFTQQLGLVRGERDLRRTDDFSELLAGGPLHPDIAAAALGLSSEALATKILPLVLEGRVVQTPDGRLALGRTVV